MSPLVVLGAQLGWVGHLAAAYAAGWECGFEAGVKSVKTIEQVADDMERAVVAIKERRKRALVNEEISTGFRDD